MIRLLVFVPAIFGMAALSGCGHADAYHAALRDQTSAMNKLAKILAGVKDKESMKSARASIQARFDEYETIVERNQALPHPSRETMESLKEEREKLGQALQEVQEQVHRISGLPAGQEFLESFAALKNLP